MPKLGVAAIPMVQNLHNIECIAALKPSFEAVFAAKAFSPFCLEVLNFLQSLSATLIQSVDAKAYPDIVTFAFWCRRSALLAMKAQYESKEIRLGRGVVFHITPSNVPVNFAYSLVVGLLAGNSNIVRVPTKEFPQVDIICAEICKLLKNDEFSVLVNHVALIRYEHDSDLTAYFSKNADVRIIWGGDAAINEIRKAPLQARSFDITLADRYSLCVINADAYIAEKDPEKVALGFYYDTYLFDQNACTAPHLVVWIGSENNIIVAKERFWSALHKLVVEKYILQPVLAVDKYSSVCNLSIQKEGVRKVRMPDNLIIRVEINSIPQDVDEFRCKAGYFLEYSAKALDEILKPVNRKYQTLSYYGFQPNILRELITNHRPCGIDRIVPIGRTTDFSLKWDGYDLIYTLSRVCSIV